jgi:hypothetical protein
MCDAIAKLPARCFVVMSNKKKMQGHRNCAAEKVLARPVLLSDNPLASF